MGTDTLQRQAFANDIERTVSMILEKEIQSLNFDKTYIGIVQGLCGAKTYKSSNCYYVKVNGKTHEAIAAGDLKYEPEDQVYVLFPGGTQLGLKTIIGKATTVPLIDLSEKVTGLNRITPKYQASSDLLLEDIQEISITRANFNINDIHDLMLYCENGVTGFVLEAQFKTDLKLPYKSFSFRYGLQLDIIYKDKFAFDSVKIEDGTEHTLSMTFDSSEMLGTVYSAGGLDIIQHKTFILSDYGKNIREMDIQQIVVSLYANGITTEQGKIIASNCTLSGIRNDLNIDKNAAALGLQYYEEDANTTPATITAEVYQNQELKETISQWDPYLNIVEEEVSPEASELYYTGQLMRKPVSEVSISSYALSSNSVDLNQLFGKVTNFQCQVRKTNTEIEGANEEPAAFSKDISIVKPADWYEPFIIDINKRPEYGLGDVFVKVGLMYSADWDTTMILTEQELLNQNFRFYWYLKRDGKLINISSQSISSTSELEPNLIASYVNINELSTTGENAVGQTSYNVNDDDLYCVVLKSDDIDWKYPIIAKYSKEKKLLYTLYVIVDKDKVLTNTDEGSLIKPDFETYKDKYLYAVYIYSTGETESQVIYAPPGDSNIDVQIDSTGGNLYISQNINTTLTAIVWQNSRDITDTLVGHGEQQTRDGVTIIADWHESAFTWSKWNTTSQGMELDKTWNDYHKSTEIDHLEVQKKAVFRCYVDETRTWDWLFEKRAKETNQS